MQQPKRDVLPNDLGGDFPASSLWNRSEVGLSGP